MTNKVSKKKSFTRQFASRWMSCCFALSVGALAGCTSLETKMVQIERLPEPAKTYVSDSVACVSDMIAEYHFATTGGGNSPIRIALVSVKDATSISTEAYPNSEIPSDMTDMALGVASRLGGPFRLIHIPSSSEYLNSARSGERENIGPAYFHGYLPSHYRGDTLLLYGALTEYDRLVRRKQQGVDGSFDLGPNDNPTNLEASYTEESNQARMTMDFRLVHPGVGDVINHASSTNTVHVYQRGRDFSLGVSYEGNSVGYGKSYSEVDARHHAIRLLVELGVAETMGRYFRVPYWRCLPGWENEGLVPFNDVLEEVNKLRFSPLVVKASNTESDVAADTDEDAEDDAEDTESRLDLRDADTIFSVYSGFNYADYLKNSTRHFAPRVVDDFVVVDGGDGQGPSVRGKNSKVNEVLSIYQRNLPTLRDLTPEEALAWLKSLFVMEGILDQSAGFTSSEMFTALWLNAPVRSQARWSYK